MPVLVHARQQERRNRLALSELSQLPQWYRQGDSLGSGGGVLPRGTQCTLLDVTDGPSEECYILATVPNLVPKGRHKKGRNEHLGMGDAAVNLCQSSS